VVKTRFPPEPNGYLHIGHAKSIVLNFGVAEDYGGTCNLRFDDTNPHKENVEFVESIKADVRWLGYDWGERLFFASDYFERLYGFAEELIEKGLAYVCDLSAEETRAYRGTLTEPGRDSPYRDRPSRRIWTCSGACVPASSRTARARCGRRSTWPRPTSTCAIRCCIASATA
jgi:glutaminyl-tRNA synthetase